MESSFVFPDGQYELRVFVPGDWESGELFTMDAAPLEVDDWPDQAFKLSGQLQHIPDEIWVSVRLCGEAGGYETSFLITPIIVPVAMPTLNGAQLNKLPKFSLGWTTHLLMNRLFGRDTPERRQWAKTTTGHTIGKR